MQISNNLNCIYTDWENFITTGKTNAVVVRAPIVESWVRSRQAGVAPYTNQVHHSLGEKELAPILRENETLIQIARPFLVNLQKFVAGSGFVIVLVSANGYIMEMLCDDDIRQKPIIRDFFQGVSWREDEVGTNAIAGALNTREPIQISGAEHYCQKFHYLTCSAAPIFGCKGELLGALDMSSASDASHLHTVGMVEAVAEAITAQLRVHQKKLELESVNNRLTDFFHKVSDAVLIVDKDEIVIDCNSPARAMFNKTGRNILGLPVSILFDRSSGSKKLVGPSYTNVEVMADTKDGLCYCLASGEPVINEVGEVTGGFIVLRPSKQVQKIVDRVNGYCATMQFSDIIGKSPEILEDIRIAKLTAASTSNLLLQGESGTGKEIFAQAVHNYGSQNTGPFVPLNCGAIPRELIGSELFGYEEGAFTGAKRGGKVGKFELASGGTLFLDEIGDMPLEQQTALLRVIQERKVSRLGSEKIIPVNVRLICATNKNLKEEVEKGTFREDLFYRLNVMSITIPPLRERVSDIPLLFDHFLSNLSQQWQCKFFVEPQVIECLIRYQWPGNVREIQNVVERAANLAENRIISVKILPEEIRLASSTKIKFGGSSFTTPKTSCREQRQKIARDTEKRTILKLLNMCDGNVSKVAREMGVSRKTVYNKMHMYSIHN